MTTPAVDAALDARDLRRGGTWTLPQRLKNFGIRLTLALLVWIADRLPPRVLLAVGRLLGRACYRPLRSKRAVTLDNLERCLPSADAAALARDVFVNAGQNLSWSLLLRRPRVRALDIVAVDHGSRRALREALETGRGVVFVSAHLGPFEAVASAVSELGHEPAIVVRESYDPALDSLVDAHRSSRGVEVIHRGAPGAPARIVRALRRGRPVGFLPDLGARVASVDAPFLGRTLDAPVGPQRIALRMGCPVVVGCLEAAPDDAPAPFNLRIEPVSTDYVDEQALTRRVIGRIAAAIERSPAHWLWMAPRLR